MLKDIGFLSYTAAKYLLPTSLHRVLSCGWQSQPHSKDKATNGKRERERGRERGKKGRGRGREKEKKEKRERGKKK